MSVYKNWSIYLDEGKFSAFYNKAQWKSLCLEQDNHLAPGNSQHASSTFHCLRLILGYFDTFWVKEWHKLFISSTTKLSNTRNSGNTFETHNPVTQNKLLFLFAHEFSTSCIFCQRNIKYQLHTTIHRITSTLNWAQVVKDDFWLFWLRIQKSNTSMTLEARQVSQIHRVDNKTTKRREKQNMKWWDCCNNLRHMTLFCKLVVAQSQIHSPI